MNGEWVMISTWQRRLRSSESVLQWRETEASEIQKGGKMSKNLRKFDETI